MTHPPSHRSHRPSRWLAVGIAAIASVCLPQAAMAQDDVQGWAGLLASGTVQGEVGVWVEAQVRVTDDASRLAQRNLRIGLGWEPSPDLSLYGGYAVFRNTPEEPATASTEHRIWQQALYTLSSSPTLRVVGRTRTEQRWRDGADGTSLRVRQMVRAVAPLGGPKTPSAIVSTEAFFELADTRWGVRSGVDQLRTFAGIGVPLKTGLSAEIGYLNQSLFGRDRPGPNHIAQVTLVARF